MLEAGKNIWRYAGIFTGKCFRNRNIIVVSEGEVKHYPISSKLQLLAIAGTIGFISWASYSTGSYFSSQSILEEKQRKIESTALLNRRMEREFALLKRDLQKIQGNTETLDEYEQFVLQQHSNRINTFQGDTTLRGFNDDNLSRLNANMLQERIDYLEEVVDQMKSERDVFVSAIRARTQEQVVAFEDIISATGLKVASLTKHPQAKLKIKEIQQSAEESTFASLDLSHQGGPYIPESPVSFTQDEEALFQQLDQMMLLSDIVATIPTARPMENAHTTSTFGRRVDPITKRWAVHKGLDFVGNANNKVKSTAEGVVTFAGRQGAYGNLIEIEHGYGIRTRYAHLGKILVAEGQTIEKGQTIGIQGNTGRSTGSHLHYEVRFNSAAMNPKKFIEAGDYVF